MVLEYGQEGHNERGFDERGKHLNGTLFDDEGFDAEGFNRDGFDRDGMHRNGTRFDARGLDHDGFDCDGFDTRGFDSRGVHRNGSRYDEDGYDIDGSDREGNERPGLTPAEATLEDGANTMVDSLVKQDSDSTDASETEPKDSITLISPAVIAQSSSMGVQNANGATVAGAGLTLGIIGLVIVAALYLFYGLYGTDILKCVFLIVSGTNDYSVTWFAASVVFGLVAGAVYVSVVFGVIATTLSAIGLKRAKTSGSHSSAARIGLILGIIILVGFCLSLVEALPWLFLA